MGSFVHAVWFKNESVFKCKNYFNEPIYCFVQMLYKAGVGFVVIFLWQYNYTWITLTPTRPPAGGLLSPKGGEIVQYMIEIKTQILNSLNFPAFIPIHSKVVLN